MTIPLMAGLHTLRVHGVKGCYDLVGGAFGDQWQYDSITVTTNSVAASVTGLFGTGLDTSGRALPAGSADAHYTLLSTPSGAAGTQPVVTSATWPAHSHSTTSRSIGPVIHGGVAPGDYVYQTTFTVIGDPTTLLLAGRMTADNSVHEVLLNGQTVQGASTTELRRWFPLTISSGFVSGVNTLQFVVRNGGSKANPSGVRVEIGLAPNTTSMP